MTTPIGGESFSPAVLWNLIALAVPIVASIVIATYKIMGVLRKEIRGEIGPIMSRIDELEKRFIVSIRDLWDHSASQDLKIDSVIKDHYRLRGSHEAIVKMGGHDRSVCNPEGT